MASQAITHAGSAGTPSQVVVGLFKHAYEAHAAIAQLKASGFTTAQIGAAFSTRHIGEPGVSTTTGTTAHEHGNWWEKVKEAFRPDDSVERRPENEPLELETTERGSAYAADDYEYEMGESDVEQTLAGTGISPARAAYLTRNLSSGGAIVTVNDSVRALEAEEILAASHAQVRYEDVEAGYAEAAYTTPRAATSAAALADVPNTSSTFDPEAVDSKLDPELDADLDDTGRTLGRGTAGLPPPPSIGRAAGDRVQLFGEVLRVHKDRIQRGEVRIHKDVVSENQTIEVPVSREELVLERVPVSGGSVATGNIGRGQEILVPLSEDKVRLEKQEVVREEILVGKREVSDVASVSDEVRHEELRVDSDLPAQKRDVTGDEGPDDLRRIG